MRRHGSITRWIDDRGFGFVTDGETGEEAFLHVSSLQRRSIRPQVGDRVSFDVELDERGRPQAIRVAHARGQVFANIVPDATADGRGRGNPRGGLGAMTWIGVVLVLGLGFGWFLTQPSAPDPADAIEPVRASPAARVRATTVPATPSRTVHSVPASSAYTCAGKTRCPQMSSCAEAMFYLQNCPGSVTDGDGDGRPCEDQWCGH